MVVAAALLAGCGDNSNECGPGTTSNDGVCLPDNTGGATCGAGTKDDGGTCVPDPDVCQNGTVLIGDKCEDPTKGLVVDVEEGAEPNGLGLVVGVEVSKTSAGTISLKPQGATTVVHGHITPARDDDHDGQLDPDFDTYVLSVTAPTLLDVSVDGVNGIDGGFYVIGSADNLLNWERYGVNIVGDLATRQIYLPVAGDYAIVVGDSRSMFIGNAPPATAGQGGAAGNANAEYYMSLTVKPLPTPTPITFGATGATTVTDKLGTDVKFYSATFGVGFNETALTYTSSVANPAIVLQHNGAFRREITAAPGSVTSTPRPADLLTAGYKEGDTALVVVDASYNTGAAAADFQLDVLTSTAKPLAVAGTIDATETDAGLTSNVDFNQFYIDATAANQIVGMSLHWDHPIDALIADQDGVAVANLTTVPNQGFVGNTFSDYIGALRFPAAGRYYLIGYDPTGVAGTDTIVASGTIENVDTVPVVENMTLTQTLPSYNLLALTYDKGTTDAWQQFEFQSSTTGDRSVQFLDPAHAYGALSSIAVTLADGSQATLPADPVPVFAHTFTNNGPLGHIVGLDPVTSYLVTVQTATGAGSTVDLKFTPRTVDKDFGAIAAGDTDNDANSVTAATPKRFYLVESAPGNRITITLTSPAGKDLRFAILGADESRLIPVDNAGAGGTDSVTIAQNTKGFTAISVDSKTAITGTVAFTLTVSVDTPFYTSTTSQTAFADACASGETLTLHPTGSFPATDEGISDAVDVPGFTFYGEQVDQLVVSSNGFVSFDVTLPDAFALPTAMPDGLGEVNIAPMWQDLEDVVVCTKTVDTKTTVQWNGREFGTGAQVAFQAILDSADGTIELVNGPSAGDGSQAIAGVQDVFGEQSTTTSEFAPIPPSSAKKLLPPPPFRH